MTEHKSLKEKWAAMGGGGPLKALQGAQKNNWLIDGVIAPNTINWMVASPESFKTFIALDMAACIASGRPWHGRPTKETPVLYLSAEGGEDIHIRRAAIDTAADDTSENFFIAQARPRVDDEEGFGFLSAVMHYWDFPAKNKLRLGPQYSHEIKIKHLDDEEKIKLEAFGDFSHRFDIDDFFWDLDKEQWNKVCDAFGYERWIKNLPPEKQASHEYLKVIFDKGENKYKQELALSKYFDGIDILHRYKGYDFGYAQAEEFGWTWGLDENQDLLIIIDTYSQTSCDDEKSTVSRYIKNLRDVQDKAVMQGNGYSITFLVIDHTTKQGDTYMGSLAKLGDCDTMMKVERPNKGRFATLKCIKKKVGIPFTPIHLELKPIDLDGFTDSQGRPISSLYVDSADGALQSRQLSSDSPENAAAQLFRLIHLNAPIMSDDLRQKFIDHESNQGKKLESVKRAFNRAIDTLKVKALVTQDSDGNLTDKQS